MIRSSCVCICIQYEITGPPFISGFLTRVMAGVIPSTLSAKGGWRAPTYFAK